MGIFTKLFSKKKTDQFSIEKVCNEINSDDLIDTLASSFTMSFDYWVLPSRRYDAEVHKQFPYIEKYSDDFQTDEGYKLRELLVLVWWGRSKKGRLFNTNKPKYFLYDYKINIDDLTKRFLDDGFLFVDDKNYIRFTETGAKILKKYSVLWDIHSLKGYKTNLDTDFPNWNENDFIVKYNVIEIEIAEGRLQYLYEDIEWFKKRGFDTKFIEQKQQEIESTVRYITKLKIRNKELTDFIDTAE